MSIRQRTAFSLVELLVVMAIIALLLSLLLPVMSRVRRAGRSATCLATLNQWGAAYRMYADANRGRAPMSPIPPYRMDDGSFVYWWELLRPYHEEVHRSLLCPEATDPADAVPRNSFQAWGPEHAWDGAGKLRASYVGSYALNGWLTELVQSPAIGAARESTSVPIVADGAWMWVFPQDTDPPATYEAHASSNMAMNGVSLERHGRGINVVFLDGHAAEVELDGLWNLAWSRTFATRKVTIPR
jgi:prepilin-type processing-associated H-X9-DG protein/prepilin-type N-terminal cleavage/methylation domain-containing protein